MSLSNEARLFLQSDVVDRFLRYVRVETTADPTATVESGPSSPGQLVLLQMLESELRELGVEDVVFDPNGYVYARIPAAGGVAGEPLGFLAHVDTSPDQPGKDVQPRLIKDYDGSVISFPDDPELHLDPEDSSELKQFLGDTIIVASGKTLLGVDDKAGVAGIMAAIATWKKFPEIPHGEVTACFTRDEEIGVGVKQIDLSRLPKFCFTVDGGGPGELESECFDAWSVTVHFTGIMIHPGYALGKKVNALVAASHFIAGLPPEESPEKTEGRQGFYNVQTVNGNAEKATVSLILRDFERQNNERRIEVIQSLIADIKARTPKLKVELEYSLTYENLRAVVEQHPRMLEVARAGIRDTGLTPKENPIRGGTDGADLSRRGHPTPNLFAGEFNIHSTKEWTTTTSLGQVAETIVHIARRWANA